VSHASTSAHTDPQSYQAEIRAAHVEVFPTTKGNFRAELTQIDLPKLWLQRGRENLPRITRALVSVERAPIFFLASANEPAIQHSGIVLGPGEIMVYRSGAEHHHQTSASCKWASMSLAPRDLISAGRTFVARDLTAVLVTKKFRPPPAIMARLLKLHATAVHRANIEPDIFEQPEVVRSLEHDLTHTMLRCLTESMPVKTGSGTHLAVMAKLEEFLAEHCDRPVYLSEICSATHTSERTLRVYCQEHLGMGPIRYLWLRRIYLARRALIQAVPGTVTVTAVATEFGFWELGRFSTEYRALFGETPFVTLRRPPEDRYLRKDRSLALRPTEFA
jgi:AraC-like DNA-binding protein